MASFSFAKQNRWKNFQDRFSLITVLLYQIIALLAFAAIPFLAADWLQKPFIGAFVEQTLMINTAKPSRAGTWGLRAVIPEFGYQVKKINGVEVTNTSQFEQQLSLASIGDTIPITLQTPTGELITYKVSLQHFALLDQLAFLFIPYAIGLIYLISSLWVFSRRHRDVTGRAFSMFTTSAALGMATLFDLYTTHRLSYLWTFALALCGGTLINLALIFPQEIRAVKRHSFLRWIGYVPAIIVALLSFPAIYNLKQPTLYVTAWRGDFLLVGAGVLIFFCTMAYRWLRSTSPIAREQSRIILRGAIISFGPLAIWFVISIFNPSLAFLFYLLLPITVFPIVTGYSILRYRLLRTDYLASRATLYASLIVITAFAYALIVSGMGQILGSSFTFANYPLLFGLVIFFIAILVLPLRTFLQKWIDTAFSRSQGGYRERLQSFSRDLTLAMELPEIIRLLRKYVDETISPNQIHIFVHDALSDHYVSTADDTGRPTTDLRFVSNSPLVTTLSQRRNSIFLGESFTVPSVLQTEKARLALLGTQLFVPLPGKRYLIGWIALGARRSGEPYVEQDLHFLEALSDQSSVAVERAQVVANLERRMHEMNILTRVSQGINITVAFDDILELIFAQAIQLIKTVDFRITLHDTFSDYLYHVFFLENDERLNDNENKPIAWGQGLEHEVIQSRRSLVTDDYERECRGRGVMPNSPGLFAWMGVPLNAGAETIGAMTLGSRDPSVTYTEEQLGLLQAIADQAAGAIVKARLLQESERRTRQLTSLNEVARSLTSTLELDRLLNQILQSAVDILNCEAGSLLLVDNQTDELVFEVAVGPVGADLVGKRMAPGSGLVGKAVQARQPIIANDVRRTKEWFEKTDQQTGFNTQDILVVPMEVKERVIGVIEVINRKDGLPFTQDDQELLAAFTSQAAVAIENARLYTMTDQALAARVEELSVMQRIDRELNASLDVTRTMRITLDWAMRQSKATAGLVGMIEESGMRMMAFQGYNNELVPYYDSYIPLDLPAVQSAIDKGQLLCLYANGREQKLGLLQDTKTQIAVPIRREAKTIGVILLESIKSETYPEETLAFLSRLSDHATIAIANAQLYSEVEAANLAKSEFVSFVSHELKTPMTSIKGFSDLLAAGVVGPVNEAQSNFLTTIRSNVDRMSTLVSDLADVSRIEAGRLRLDFGAVLVSDVIDEVVRSIRAQIDEKKQTLNMQTLDDLPAMWGDRLRLIQILTNLVSNAYKYSPESSQISVTAEATQNQWDPSGAPKVIHISVKDTGFGISEEDQKKIFQKFFRSEDQRVREAPGTGLGLNITKTLVEMQGGKIWFETEYRKGTTFHFTVPVAETV